MTKIKLLLTIFYALFAYSCTEQTIYSGKIINQANIDYSIIKDKNQLVEMLSKIGVIEVVDAKNEIYRVVIAGQVRVGFKQANYAAIQRFVKRHKNYRTYRYEEAANSSVFLEPIALPKVLAEALIET